MSLVAGFYISIETWLACGVKSRQVTVVAFDWSLLIVKAISTLYSNELASRDCGAWCCGIFALCWCCARLISTATTNSILMTITWLNLVKDYSIFGLEVVRVFSVTFVREASVGCNFLVRVFRFLRIAGLKLISTFEQFQSQPFAVFLFQECIFATFWVNSIWDKLSEMRSELPFEHT